MITNMPTFNRVTIKSILDDLHSKKITVIVPSAALYSEAEITAQKEVTQFVNNAPIEHKRNMGNEVTYTGTTANIVDKEISNDSALNRTTVRLPLSTVIDLFHKQYSVYIPKKNNDLPLLIEFINDILNRLENSSDKKADELFNYVDSFYETVIKNQKTNIAKRFDIDGAKLPGLKPVAGFTSNTMAEDSINKATFIDVDSITV